MTSSEEPNNSTLIAERGITRSILVFGFPLVLAMGFHALFNLVDMWIVGKLGTAALAAVTIGSMINTVPMVIFNGVSNSSIAFMARNLGFGNVKRANDVMNQSFLLTLFLSVILGVLPYLYAKELVLLFHAEGPEVIRPAVEYLEVMSLGTITIFFLMQISAALRAVGDGLWPMILLVGANLLNIVLDWGLVFGEWGLPRLGVAGAGWATVISRALFCLIGFAILMRGKGGLRLQIFRVRMQFQVMFRIFRVAVPASMQWLVRLIAYLALLKIVGGQFGKTAQAAFGVGLRLDLFAIYAGFGWGMAASTLVGQNMGRGRLDQAARCTWVAAGLNTLMMAGLGITYFLSASFLVRFFGADKEILDLGQAAVNDASFGELVSLGTTYIRVIVFSYIFISISIVLSHALNGAGSTRSPMVIDTIGFLMIQLPLAYYLSRHPDYGLIGVWYAIVASNAIIAAVYVLWFKIGRWKLKKLW